MSDTPDTPSPAPTGCSDARRRDQIAQIIREGLYAIGATHGPRVETYTVPEEKLLAALPGIASTILALPHADAGGWRRITPGDARTPMLLWAPPERLYEDPRGKPGQIVYSAPADFTWATLCLEINAPIPEVLKGAPR